MRASNVDLFAVHAAQRRAVARRPDTPPPLPPPLRPVSPPDEVDFVRGAGYCAPVRVVARRTGAELFTASAREAAVQSVAQSADRALVVVGFTNCTAQVWRVDSTALLRVLGRRRGAGPIHEGGAVVVSADARRVLLSRDCDVCVWGAADGRLYATLARGHGARVCSVAMDRAATTAASGDDGGAVCVWDMQTGALRSHGQPHAAHVVFLRVLEATEWHGVRVLSVGADATLSLRDCASGAELVHLALAPLGAPVFLGLDAIAACAVVAATGPVVGVWRLDSGRLVSLHRGRDGPSVYRSEL